MCVFISLNINGQGSSANLDELNGLKGYKFFSSSATITSKFSKSSTKSKSSRIIYYVSYDSELTKFGAQFKSITLSYIDDKLFSIKLWTFETYDELKIKSDLGLKSDYVLAGEEIDKLFGKTSNYKEEKDAIKSLTSEFWETDKIKMEFSFLVYGKEASTYIIIYNKELQNKANVAEYE